jgi:cysteinyl-tRNA synthetase
MSKSLGNFFTVHDLLLAGLPGHQKMPGAVIRFVFLQTHYRKPMDWRQATAVEAVKRLDIWSSEVSAAQNIKDEFQSDEEKFVRAFLPSSILEAVADDLNTSLAMTNLVSIGKQLEGPSRRKLNGREVEQVQRELVAGAAFLGLNLFEYTSPYSTEVDLSGLASKLMSLRATAMETKDFSEVDGMKAALIAAGVEVRMSKDGVVLHPGAGFDATKLEGLV